jgi:NADH-quinone oxidoreductase subunit M
LFGEELTGSWGVALMWLAVASLLYGSLVAFRQPDARGVVAYSSLAQMGLIFLGLTTINGVGAEQGLAGAYLQTINHGLISAGLFLFIGIVEQRAGTGSLAELGSLARGRARLLTIALTLALIALAVPGASTFAGELLVLAGAFRGDSNGALVAGIASLAVVLAAMYALRLVAAVAFTPSPESSTPAHDRFGGDLSVREVAIVGPVIVALLVLSVWPNLVRRPMNQPPVPIAVETDPLGAFATDEQHGGESHSHGAKDGEESAS